MAFGAPMISPRWSPSSRRGLARLYGFRWKDWSDYKSCLPSQALAATDQVLGVGDGSRTAFQLVKAYASGAQTYVRPIVKPVAGTVAGRARRCDAVLGVDGRPHDRHRHLRGRARRRRERGGRVRVRRAGAVRHRPARHHPRHRAQGLDRLDPAGGDPADESDPRRPTGASRHADNDDVLLLARHPQGRRRAGVHRARPGPGLRRDDVSGEQRIYRQPGAAVAGPGGRQPECRGGALERCDQRRGPGGRPLRRRLCGALLGQLEERRPADPADGGLHRRGEDAPGSPSRPSCAASPRA